jgi:MFS transporter, DHA2 family, multidrug resistance protein
VLIPLVFSAIFLMMPKGAEQTAATAVGGFLAVLGPALGPIIGGWLTEHYSWHWLFLINVPPGIIAIIAGFIFLPKEGLRLSLFKQLDWLSLLAFGVCLALLVIGLKEAPTRGWLSPIVLGAFVISASLLAFTIYRPSSPILFYLLKDRPMAFGCVLSFLIGFLLFASVYIQPVFLGFVRNHSPLTIGMIVLTMGIAQLVVAFPTVFIDRFFDARLLTGAGFIIFGLGLYMNGHLTVNADEPELFWPQVLRGISVTLCVLPPIRIALALMPVEKVSDASGLFNLVRNMGGIIGIAVMDTIMFSRAPEHAETLMELTKTDPEKAAPLLGVTLEELPAPDDTMGLFATTELAQTAGLTSAINECWMLLTVIAALAIPILWALGPVESAKPVGRRQVA